MVRNIRVIDAHTHIFPAKIAQKAIEHTDDFYGVRSVLDGSAATLLRAGGAAGIDHFITCAVATTPHQVGAINRFIAQNVAESGGRLTGLGTLHPDSDDLERDVEEILSLGLRGVKLHPDIQGFKLDDYRCLKIYELCEGRLPLLFHTGDSRYDLSNPNRLIPILETYTGLTVVGAHFGGYLIWEKAVPLLCGHPNFYVDCSSSFPYLSREQVRSYIAAYGPDRVLFGTDYPMWAPGPVIDTLLSLELPAESLELIFHKNAEKVFGIPDAGAARA